jgi:Cu/Ag efflux protein CusF
MKKGLIAALALCLALSGAAIAQDAPQSDPSQAQSSQQAKSLSGTITQVDNDQKLFVVKDDAGQLVTVYWNESTRISGGDLKEGASVSLQATDQGGKMFATSVQIRTK